MAEPRPLLIFPCNGNGLDALDCLGEAHQCEGFVDDTPEKQGRIVLGQPVFARAALGARAGTAVLAVPGSPTSYRRRREIIAGLGVLPERFARVIHPTARVAPHAVVGRNVLIMAGVVVTSNAVIGDHVVILPNVVVDHDVVVGAWTVIAANVMIGGGTTVGENCYLGGGASISNGLSIGAGALVGLGSAVIRDVAAGTCVVGNPARVLRAKTPTP